MHNINSIDVGTGNTDNYQYGNSTLGFYTSREGFEGANYENMMQQSVDSGIDHIKELTYLEELWNEVE